MVVPLVGELLFLSNLPQLEETVEMDVDSSLSLVKGS